MSAVVIRSRLFSFHERPVSAEDAESYAYWEDGALVVLDGKIAWRGDAGDLPETYRALDVKDHRPHLVMAGFIDVHTHFPQMGVIGSYGAQLMDWLSQYTFRQEARFADPEHCEAMASAYLDELLSNGVTTAAVFASSHKASADAFFAEADKRNLRMIAGKVLMDRNAAANVQDTAQSGFDDSQALIDRWHGNGRLHYAVTPRFAITSTPEQMELAAALLKAHPDCYVQTHLSENQSEIALTAQLYPDAADYLGVYERFDLLGPRSLFGHCIHLTTREKEAMRDSGSVAVFCPTSNLFLGSGLFDYQGLDQGGISLAMGSDVGGGTSYSMLATAAEGYKICQLQGVSLHPLETFYRLTLGNATALSLSDYIGALNVGSDADLVVLDSRATSAMAMRMACADTLIEELFVLQTLGDDRCIVETYAAGAPVKPIRAPGGFSGQD